MKRGVVEFERGLKKRQARMYACTKQRSPGVGGGSGAVILGVSKQSQTGRWSQPPLQLHACMRASLRCNCAQSENCTEFACEQRGTTCCV